VTNHYHRYLNLPFQINPLKKFKEQGDQIQHHLIKTAPFPQVDQWFHSLNLKCYLKECFYTPPHSKIPIHTDHSSYTNHAKINVTWGPKEGVIQWWHSDHVKEKVTEANENTIEYHHNLVAEEKDCTLLYEANTNRPSLVNVGVLHGTNNPTDQGRWTVCFVPTTLSNQFIEWNDAMMIFKNYIVEE